MDGWPPAGLEYCWPDVVENKDEEYLQVSVLRGIGLGVWAGGG